jgi:hypothetical protein
VPFVSNFWLPLYLDLRLNQSPNSRSILLSSILWFMDS